MLCIQAENFHQIVENFHQISKQFYKHCKTATEQIIVQNMYKSTGKMGLGEINS